MTSVAFRKVGKVYTDGGRALTDLDLTIEDGELIVFVGPSGCGKSTALRIVAGLETVTEGEILIGDHCVNDVPPQARDIAMVFQNYALYPHLNVYDNIAYPLKSRRLPGAEIRERVEQTARLLGLTETLGRKPRTLSGGQRQRVAMARAMVRDPQVFLMDEPLSNLDAKLRVQMRAEISRLQSELGVTMIYVTHDQVEAMTMGDRIAVMRKGVLQQLGPADELYDHPHNLFVATFIGSPPMNLMRAQVSWQDGSLSLAVGSQRLDLSGSTASLAPLRGYDGREVAIGVRPEHSAPINSANDAWPRLRCVVRLVELLGAEKLVHLEADYEPVLVDEVIEIAADVDASLAQSLQANAGTHRAPFIARFDPDTSVHAPETIEIALRPDRIRVFDLETGRAVAQAVAGSA